MDTSATRQTSSHSRSETVHPGCSGHHHPLWRRPLLRICQQADAEPFADRRQLFVLAQRTPGRRAFVQLQSRSACACFTLLARQPIAQRRYEVVVGELIEPLPVSSRCDVRLRNLRWCRRRSHSYVLSGRYRGRDQADLRIENLHESGEVLGPLDVTRGVQQFLVRAPTPLDICARFGEQ